MLFSYLLVVGHPQWFNYPGPLSESQYLELSIALYCCIEPVLPAELSLGKRAMGEVPAVES